MNKLASGIIFALAILGGLFVVLTIFFAISDNTDVVPTNSVVPTVRDDVEVPTAVPTRNVSDYIGYEMEQAFMGGCVPEAGFDACQCMFDYIDDNMTNEELINFMSLENMESHPMFNETINNCI